MPTIELKISDLESLLFETVDEARLALLLEKVKGEVKAFNRKEDITKLELNDTNRPDLWCPEGIVRQIKSSQNNRYPFFDQASPVDHRVSVSNDVTPVRPYLAACTVTGLVVTHTILTQLIQFQEKMSDTFGRKRKTLSVGLYRLQKIVFPVHYGLADPDAIRFVPLGFDRSLSLREILIEHPKGKRYADILNETDRYPLLTDAKGQILSFPPIINSREVGEVQEGDSELFVEVTGTDLRMVVLALNIFACNLFDRGGVLRPVTIEYPHETALGKQLKCPLHLHRGHVVPLKMEDVQKVLGEAIPCQETMLLLERYGYTVLLKEEGLLHLTPPPYREDVMHSVDVIEDIAISRGFGSFQPKMPSTFTIGGLSSLENDSDQIRNEMIGLGFCEIVSNILGSKDDFLARMRRDAITLGGIVEIENPMNERFSFLRPSLLPSLLRVEEASSGAFYPHRIFEVGEWVQWADTTESSKTIKTGIGLAGIFSNPTISFSDLHAVLNLLFFRLSCPYDLEPVDHPTFIEGRSGHIMVEGMAMGVIGEIHPEVLSRWHIGMPTVAFEIYDIEQVIRSGGCTISNH